MEPKSFVDLDAGFTPNDASILMKYQLPPHSILFEMSRLMTKLLMIL